MVTGAADAADEIRLPAGFALITLEVCDSTNDEAKERARLGAADGTVVWAKRQEAGRGRRGRAWASPSGNLYVSLVLRPPVPPAQAALVSFVAAVAVADAVSALVPGHVRLKWPNDVLIDGAKVSGILLESERAADGAVDWLVLGVGVNVAHHPQGMEYAATSLHAAGAPVPVERVLERFLGAFAAWYARWTSQGFAPIRAAWLNAARGFGGPVTVRLSDETFTGLFVDLDGEGGLVVETPSGPRRVTAGDVFFG